MARRTKLTNEVQHNIITAIQTGATYEMAASFGNITRATLWLWLKKGQEQSKGIYRTFFDAFKRAEAQAGVRSLAIVNKAAQDGNWQAAAWLLERRFGYDRNNPAVQVNIDAQGSLSSRSVAELVEEVRERQKLLTVVNGPLIDLDEE